MISRVHPLRVPAIVGVVLTLPFLLLEVMNQGIGNFPIVLFGLLWILPAAFAFVSLPIVRTTLASQAIGVYPGLFLRIGLLAGIAWMWAAIVVDQLPCFLGVPNCD